MQNAVGNNPYRTGEDGTVTIPAKDFVSALGSGSSVKLYIKETKAPAGYKLPGEDEASYELQLTKDDATDPEKTVYSLTYNGKSELPVTDERITISIPVTKTWVDNGNTKKPTNIKVHLLQNNQEYRSVDIKAAEDGTWTYTFENVPEYDDAGQKITYTIKEDSVENYDTKIDGYNITNTYLTTQAVLEGTKKLSGRDLTDKDVFTFDVRDTKGNLVTTGTSDKSGKITFNPITYTISDAGLHQYFVTEEQGNEDCITYSTETKHVSVNVVYSAEKGTLTATPSYGDGDLTFTNSYTTDTKTVALVANKVLENKDLKAGEFSFELKDSDGKVLQTVKNDADGKITFDPLTYKLADAGKEFTYTVNEVNDGKKGITYDGTVYTVTVKVTDNGDGTLSADVTGASDLKFTNTYTTNKATAALVATKVLENRDLKADEFSFELKDSSGKVLQTVKNDASGKVTFAPLTYTLADAGKTFTYTVSEVAGSEKGITYDSKVYDVTVKVTDNGDGTLSADVTGASDLKFTNTYTTNKATAALVATKVLENKDLKADEFSFELKDSDGKVLQTVKNDAEGKITFAPLTYTLADAGKTFDYTVSEAAGSESGITYDNRVYDVTVKVTDNGDGTLSADVTGASDRTRLRQLLLLPRSWRIRILRLMSSASS